ncbi:hypothetical protein ARMGADRAFT_1036757 [Armillaria gallica]|uniref:Uncharacterized protein n=1 Tax=Armillaria gallica TaxID=47427 RepID=A0A2H3CP17_ARMGA|nr:hypothetical protein ARMGADRAFT_1036757 [Armillaria gallica]
MTSRDSDLCIPQSSSAGPSSPLEDPKYKRLSGKPSKAYNLEKKLVEECEWSSEDFECIKDEVKAWATQEIGLKLCYRMQLKKNPLRIDHIIGKAQSKYPWLKPYNICWPVHAMLKIILKNGLQNYQQRHHIRDESSSMEGEI